MEPLKPKTGESLGTGVVYGTFTREEDAAEAVRALMSKGFDVRYISALILGEAGMSELSVSVESGVTRGAVLGATLGAAGGALLATAPGLLAAGSFVAAIEAAVGGGALGSVHGGILGILFGETKVEFSQKDLDEGAILIGVSADTRAELACEVLTKQGATRVTRKDVAPLPPS